MKSYIFISLKRETWNLEGKLFFEDKKISCDKIYTHTHIFIKYVYIYDHKMSKSIFNHADI